MQMMLCVVSHNARYDMIINSAHNPGEVDSILGKSRAGERLSKADGLKLLASDDIIALGAAAHAVKRRRNGEQIFFNVNCHLNLTNICAARCGLCAFSCDTDDANAYCMDQSEAVERVRAAGAGVTEIHMVSALHPEKPFSYYLDMVACLHREFPHLHIKAFTAAEIHYFSKIAGVSLNSVLSSLKDAGLGSLPGGGAEVLNDRVRASICPHKASSAEWLAVMRAAHELGLKSNATLLFGHIETAEDIIDHLLSLRSLQDDTAGFQTFIPLPFHPENTMFSGRGARPGAVEILRMISVSRLMLDNFEHIKAYWVMTGVPTAQIALVFGADDIDGTVLEEKITHAAGATTATGLGRDTLIEVIRQSGSRPVERDSLYQVLRQY
jgi:aminodeoxyfutalosine synthase